MKKFFKDNINKIAVVIIALNLFIYTLLSTTAYADDFVDKPVVTTPSTDLSVVMSPVIGPQQLTAEIFSKAADELILWETGKLNDILNEQIGADDVLKDYYEVYYDLLVNDYQNIVEKYCAGGSKFNSDGSFVTEYTNAYYRHYFKSLYQFSEPFDWDLFIEYADERHKSETSGSSTDTSAYIKRKGGKPQFSSPAFKKYIDDTDIVYYPLGSVSKVSWKTDKNFSNSSFDSKRTRAYFTVLEKYNFFGIDGLKEFYAVPFFEYGDELYFSNYCIYFNLGIQQINSSGEISLHTFDIGYVDVFNTAADLKNTEVYKSLFDETIYSLAEESYIVDRINSNLYAAWYYGRFGTSIALQKREDFLSSPGLVNAGNGCAFFKGFTPFVGLYNSKNLTLSVSSNVFNTYFTSGALSEKAEDYGFYISETPIIMDCFGADIDTSKIPDTYYITVSGDTIYDYSITNPDTGQSSTINEYITNNYTYITNNNPGGDGSGSGTTGGNVTVGGNVGVNGNVNVGGEVKFGGEVNVGVDVSPIDINVNVSGNGGAGESGGDPPEIGGVDDLVHYLPEKSPVISEYLKIFFDVLPPELLNLILAGVAAAIIILIFRR